MLKISQYSNDDLQDIANSSKTWSDISKAIGYSSYSSIGVIKKYFKQNNISFHSFGQQNINNEYIDVPCGVITIDQLIQIVKSSSTYKEIGLKLGYSYDSSSTCSKKLLNKLSISFKSTCGRIKKLSSASNKNKICLVCGKSLWNNNKVEMCYDCYSHYQNKLHIDQWLKTGRYCENKSLKIPRYVKEYIIEQQQHKCSICGLPEQWNGKPLVFICDHIDGNADNQVRENLRCICPNCDSQLDTYKSKNKNSARSYRRIAS